MARTLLTGVRVLDPDAPAGLCAWTPGSGLHPAEALLAHTVGGHRAAGTGHRSPAA